MNEEYNLTIQEFLYKKSGADHFVYIDENDFEEIKDEMFLSKDEPGNYHLEEMCIRDSIFTIVRLAIYAITIGKRWLIKSMFNSVIVF